MKTFIACIFTVICSIVHAQESTGRTLTVTPTEVENCQADLEEKFIYFQQRAISYNPTYKNEILAYRVRFHETDKMVDAITTYGNQLITFDLNKMCKLSEIERAVIVDHEFGHVVASAIYPETLNNQRRLKSYTVANQEAIANNLGVVFFPPERYEQAFALMDGLCKNGNQYQCERASAWRYGLGRIE